MPIPGLLQADFTAGVRRNRSRDDLGSKRGANVLWNGTDWIINRLGVPLGKRGGWGYAGSAFSGSPGRVRSIADAPMNGGHYLLAVDSNGAVYRTSGGSPGTWAVDSTTLTVGALKQNPLFFLDTMIFPSPDGTAGLRQANENSVLVYNTGTFKPTRLASHYGRIVGAVGETLIWGPPGAPNQVWDDNASYDLTQPIVGLWSSGLVLLAFYDGHMDRVSGSTPAGYGVTADNISIQPYSQDVGCIDAFSIVGYQGTVVWADKHGVWQTDGLSRPIDLTWAGGASDLYSEFMSVYDATNHRVAAGVVNDLLVLTITNLSTHAAVDTLICDLPRRVWYRWSNCPFTCFARNTRNAQETWAGYEPISGRVASLSSVFLPTSANSADADTTPVLPSLETAYYRFGPMPTRVYAVWLGFEMDFLGTAATLVNQNITYTAVTTGVEGNEISMVIKDGLTLSVAVDNDAQGVRDAKVITITLPDTTTKAELAAAIAADAVASTLVTAVVAGGHTGDTSISTLTSTALAGGTVTVAGLTVDFSTDPKAAPVFESPTTLYPTDGHGEDSRGYHWKKKNVRRKTPGIAVRIRQTAATAKTSIHALGSEQTPLPTYTKT